MTETTIGRYHIRKEIGSGGMGRVFEAYDPLLHRKVALKLRIKEDFSQKEYARFLREAKHTAKLRHTNIVSFYDIGEEENGRVFFTMDLIEGHTLGDFIAKNRLSFREVAQIVKKIAMATHYAHTQGIVHRDIKPNNIMLSPQGEPLLMDFGLAKEIGEGTTAPSQKTDVLVGTVAYMPPEQIEGKVNLLSDIYSLGAVLYKLLTGRVPFYADNSVKMIFKILDAKLIPPQRFDPNIPEPLSAICIKALDKNPKLRYQNAQKLAEDLTCYLKGEPIKARPAPVLIRMRYWLAYNKLKATVFLSLIIAFISLTLLGVFVFVNNPPKKVLLLFSYEKELLWDIQIKKAILSTFKENLLLPGENIILQEHYMQTKRFHKPEQITQRVEIAKEFINEYQPDLVISIDDNASGKVVPHFFNTPMQFIFCGVNNNPKIYKYPQSNASGICERLLVGQTFKMIPYFLPKAKNYVLVIEDSVSAKIALPQLEKHLRVQTKYNRLGTLISSHFSDWEVFLEKYENEIDFVFAPIYLSLKDRKDQHIKPEKVMQWIIDNTNKPPIGVLGFNIKHGALLGVVDSGNKQGTMAAQYAVQVLKGHKKAGELQISEIKRGDLYINETTARCFNIKIPQWVYQWAIVFK